MLLWMVHRRVTDSAAWQAAFQCFVAFVTYFGYIDKARCVSCPARRPSMTNALTVQGAR